jgi:hypothetical protein
MHIIINQDTTAIVKRAELRDLPDFILITGENGTGKSQFLAYQYRQSADFSGILEEMMAKGDDYNYPINGVELKNIVLIQ